MGEHDWRLAKAIFGEALELPADRRAAFLDGACAGDTALRARVEGLLAADVSAGEFMRTPTLPPPGQDASTVTHAGDDDTERVGERIGPYTLLGIIGEGGFGVVYAADQTGPLRRRVALKVIRLGMDTREVIARFEQERQALALMDHPSIARVYDAGATARGRPYFVMELIEGVPITEYCDTARLSPRERLELFIPVCQAVQHAHQKGIIHRDLKPGNVLVTLQDGRPVPKIIDFGVAKATAHTLTERTVFTERHQFIGTPEYMSPEQANLSGLDVDTRTDVYALGVLLYELLIGATPLDPKRLRSAAFAEMQRIIREVDPPKPSTRLSTLDTIARVAACRQIEPGKLGALVRGDLDWIVMRCLEKDRSRRYETASALAADVQRHLSGEPVVAAPPGRGYRIRKFVRRNKSPVLAAALLAAALLAGIAGTTAGLIRARSARSAESLQHQQSEKIAEFMQRIFLGVGPSVALGRDTAMLEELLDAAAKDIEGGELGDNPEAEMRLRVTIGMTYASISKFEAAERVLTAGLELARRTLHGDHPLLATTLNALGELRLWQERASDGETVLHEALTMRQRLWSGDNADVAESLNNEAYALQALGYKPAARSMFEDALAMRQRLVQGDDRDVSESLSNLGYCLASMHQWADALPRHQAALEMRQHLFKGDHPDIALSLNNVGSTLLLLDLPTEALPMLNSALAMNRRIFNRDNAAMGVTLNNVARCLRLLGKAQDALAQSEEGLALRRRVFKNQDHATIADSLEEVALDWQALEHPADAERRFRECLGMRERLFPDDHPLEWQRCWTRSLLGGTLVAQDRFAAAEPYLVDAYTGLRDDPLLPPPVTGEKDRKGAALERVVHLYEAWDKADPGKGYDTEAAQWKAKLDALTPAASTDGE